MPSRKRKKRAARVHKENPHLPGYLLIALGLLALPINFGLLPGLEWAKAWPLLVVLFGIVFLVKTELAKGRF